MFRPFRRHVPTYPAESSWSVLQGEHDGRPMFVRRNDSARQLLRHPEYRHRVGVAIAFREHRFDGLPTENETPVLLRIEDALAQELEADQVSLQVLSITTNDMRELVFYTRAPSIVPAVVEKVQARFRSHRIQHYVKDDPRWTVYKHFA
jgi:Family of unknown function (DUF695)